MGATPGGLATLGSQNAWLPILKKLRTEIWGGGWLTLSHAPSLMDASGNYTDEATRKQLADFVSGFAAFAGRVRGSA
jgi:hypothetical protein